MLKSMTSLKRELNALTAGQRPPNTKFDSKERLSQSSAESFGQSLLDKFASSQDADQSASDLDNRPNKLRTKEVFHYDSSSSVSVDNKETLAETKDGGRVLTHEHIVKSSRENGLQVNEVARLEIKDDSITQYVLSSTSFHELSGEILTIDLTGRGHSTHQSFNIIKDTP